MSITNLLKVAMTAIMSNKFRSFLSMLGIIIGVAAVIIMMAIGQGSKESLIGGACDLAGDMGFRVLPQHLIEYAVRDLIADLVRVAPGHGFGGKYAFFHRK